MGNLFSVRRSVREVVQVRRRCSRFTGYVEDKGSSIGVAMGDVSRVRDSAVWMNLMRLPSWVSLLEDVQNGGLHVVELELATWCLDGKDQLGNPDV